MTKWNTFMALALAGLVMLTGCHEDVGFGSDAPTHPTQGQLVLMAEPDTPIEDVPVPIYFKLDESNSQHYATGNARYVDHTYNGSADKYAVAAFYRLEMARSRWELVSDHGSAGVLTLHFDKGSEWCVVTISNRFDLFRPTGVHVQMWTTGRLPAPPGATPLPMQSGQFINEGSQ